MSEKNKRYSRPLRPGTEESPWVEVDWEKQSVGLCRDDMENVISPAEIPYVSVKNTRVTEHPEYPLSPNEAFNKTEPWTEEIMRNYIEEQKNPTKSPTKKNTESSENNEKVDLINKYTVAHTDGSPIDPQAEYFVLRIDAAQQDTDHYNACLLALQQYANDIKKTQPVLADDLNTRYIYPWSDDKIAGNASFLKYNKDYFSTGFKVPSFINVTNSTTKSIEP